MTYDWQIKTGDFVAVYLNPTGDSGFEGVVRHYPQATGEAWIIESTHGIHYVQTYAQIVRSALHSPQRYETPK